MKTTSIIALLSLLSLFAAACSSASDTTANRAANNTPVTTAENSAPGAVKKAASDDIPAPVHAVFPDAQSITKEHKEMSAATIASIEKTAGSKVPDTDHHSYVAYSTSGGARKQIGAATVVEAGGKKMVVVYESRNNQPYIKEVRVEGLAPAFLDQFKGKGADDKFQIGQDLKAQGVADATAKAIATSIHIDVVTMRTLYGSTQAQ
jgi:hypothetical protein